MLSLGLISIVLSASAAYADKSPFPPDAWLPPDPSQVSNAIEFTLDHGFQSGSTQYVESSDALMGIGETNGQAQTVNSAKPLFVSFTIQENYGPGQTIPDSDNIAKAEIGYRVGNDAANDTYMTLDLSYTPGDGYGGSYLGNQAINVPSGAQGTLYVWARFTTKGGRVGYISGSDGSNYPFSIAK